MTALGLLIEGEYYRAPQILAQLREGYEVHDFSGWRQWDRAELARRCRSVEVLLTGHASPKLPAELAEDFGRLRYVCHAAGSIRHVVSKRLLEAGLLVTNWGDAPKDVSEGALALVLALLKQVATLSAFMKGGPDQRISFAYRPTLRERDVGLYGFGPLGRHMAALLAPCGAKIAIYDPYARNVPPGIRVCATLRELFSTCQIISLHCGLNDQTRFSVNRELLELLPQGGIVVNTARGDILVEQDLADLVAQGRLLAGLDVIHNESAWPACALAPNPGVFLTGHRVSAGKTLPGVHGPPHLPSFVVQNLRAYREGGELINTVTVEMYDLKT